MSYTDFGDMLRQLRKSRNLTQKDLGAKVGLSKAVVSKYENGIGFPTLDTLVQIARCFNVTTDYLLGVSNSKTVDVSGLTNQQIEMLSKLIQEFSELNHK